MASAAEFPRTIPTDDLAKMAAPYNPREMLDHDWEQLCRSLREFGVVQPVVVNKRTEAKGWKKSDAPVIVGGHQRVRAASDESVAIAKMPVEWVDLTNVQERQLNLILNRTSGGWEEDMLERALREIEELGGGDALDFTGFDVDELEAYLGNAGDGPGGEGPGGFKDPGDETDNACPKCGYRWNG